jgi:hypothetical protein
MSYRIAGIDVHKKILAVVVADVAVEGEFQFERRQFGTTSDHLRLLTEWLIEQEVEEAVMESTAQYWKPVWEALERVLATEVPEARERRPDVGKATSGTCGVQSRAAGAQEGFP